MQQKCCEFPLRITAYIISENNPDKGEPFGYEMANEELNITSGTTILYPIPLYHENPEYLEYFDDPLLPIFLLNMTRKLNLNAWCPFEFESLIVQQIMELAMKVEDLIKEEKFIFMKLNPRNVNGNAKR
ncbi:hypothetical protein Glove_300g80 [Diversispora epigaea]|uniref:Uncharacterized protein n=1 Tax=Diversispora epigaea TaxID=1348612 RepID=A0A397HWK1_9GLOM|nr:hypothetical protein Glove_300g80 [Diversispora epigaea]